jgi:hypothetical protein
MGPALFKFGCEPKIQKCDQDIDQERYDCEFVIRDFLSLGPPFRGVFFFALFLVGRTVVLFVDLLARFDSRLAALSRLFAGCSGGVLGFFFFLIHIEALKISCQR